MLVRVEPVIVHVLETFVGPVKVELAGVTKSAWNLYTRKVAPSNAVMK